jgi:hypothetical protein
MYCKYGDGYWNVPKLALKLLLIPRDQIKKNQGSLLWGRKKILSSPMMILINSGV